MLLMTEGSGIAKEGVLRSCAAPLAWHSNRQFLNGSSPPEDVASVPSLADVGWAAPAPHSPWLVDPLPSEALPVALRCEGSPQFDETVTAVPQEPRDVVERPPCAAAPFELLSDFGEADPLDVWASEAPWGDAAELDKLILELQGDEGPELWDPSASRGSDREGEAGDTSEETGVAWRAISSAENAASHRRQTGGTCAASSSPAEHPISWLAEAEQPAARKRAESLAALGGGSIPGHLDGSCCSPEAADAAELRPPERQQARPEGAAPAGAGGLASGEGGPPSSGSIAVAAAGRSLQPFQGAAATDADGAEAPMLPPRSDLSLRLAGVLRQHNERSNQRRQAVRRMAAEGAGGQQGAGGGTAAPGRGGVPAAPGPTAGRLVPADEGEWPDSAGEWAGAADTRRAASSSSGSAAGETGAGAGSAPPHSSLLLQLLSRLGPQQQQQALRALSRRRQLPAGGAADVALLVAAGEQPGAAATGLLPVVSALVLPPAVGSASPPSGLAGPQSAPVLSKRRLGSSVFGDEFAFESMEELQRAGMQPFLSAASSAGSAGAEAGEPGAHGVAGPSDSLLPAKQPGLLTSSSSSDSRGASRITVSTSLPSLLHSSSAAGGLLRMPVTRRPAEGATAFTPQLSPAGAPALAAGGAEWQPSGAAAPLVKAAPSLFGGAEDEREVAPADRDALRRLLLLLAEAVATGDEVGGERGGGRTGGAAYAGAAVHLLLADKLRLVDRTAAALADSVSPLGSPAQRVAFYLLQALQRRAQGSLTVDYLVEPHQTAEEEALIMAFAARNPCMQFCYTTMACGIYEALEGEDRVHILDFAMWAGQWPLVIRQLATRHQQAGRHLPLSLRFTAVDAPQGHPYGAGPRLPAAFLQAELSRAAAESSVRLAFARVEARPEALQPAALQLAAGEALVVNFAGRLATLADSKVLRSSPKDAALAAVAVLQPRVITTVEWDMDQQQPFFLPRFRAALTFFANVFESHEVLAGRSSFGRQGFEERVLAREMLNLVAYEGLQRLVRADTLSRMHGRAAKASLGARPFSPAAMSALRHMIGQYPPGFEVREHPLGGVQLFWAGRSILGASAWAPAAALSGCVTNHSDV